jgi:hypothetical protein
MNVLPTAMSARHSGIPYRRPRNRQRGIAALEFAIVSIIFFTLFFGIVELSRAMYICNTLQEVTRRAAAMAVNTDFSNAAAMQRLREQAIFRTSPGTLMLGEPVTDQHIKIDYLQIPSIGPIPVPMSGALPASPQENRVNCATSPTAANCIALVRVRICAPGGGTSDCTPVTYKTMVSLIALDFSLPPSTTIARIETLGLAPGTPCPCQ